MDVNVSKDKHIGLIEITSTILDEIQSKTVHNHKENDGQKEKGVKHWVK